MKAISPVRSMRSCYEAVCCISEQSLAIARSKTATEEPMNVLYDMNDCYSKLKELVPSIPQNKSVSQVEILQHVIDYIFDLQIALKDEEPTEKTSDVVLSIKASDFGCDFTSGDGTLHFKSLQVWDNTWLHFIPRESDRRGAFGLERRGCDRGLTHPHTRVHLPQTPRLLLTGQSQIG
ncbi:DNA-binding protein inhibitor ID-3 [Acipenser oxyrinchus oxyrinchus]|uniref:DNA-binding protein inhibitor ID-4 n=1 Tax=Acipenser oxyrinchus oxyrinchus TaxID=40147 RepID=A0AAD8CEP7_ACIOX|nr:DNA-binding protein inhibitor ID-3 [Acipenser oxyrinchus oxyrinchus]